MACESTILGDFTAESRANRIPTCTSIYGMIDFMELSKKWSKVSKFRSVCNYRRSGVSFLNIVSNNSKNVYLLLPIEESLFYFLDA